MNRADRLLLLADELRARDETTIDALALVLGTSRRTLLRDLSTLRDRGMAIAGERGRGGGIRLESGRGVATVHLALSEIVGIWLAARLSREASALPWSDGARAGLAKLLGSLPRERERALKHLARRVMVGPPASERVRAGSMSPPPELLRLFEEAFTDGTGLGFHYRDSEGRETVRRIEPHGLLVETPVWYLLARDVDKGEARTFRMDRVSRPRLLRDVRFVPDERVLRENMPECAEWKPLTA
jgi:predicted DNA-binding transcriptional regulator YafY